MNKYYKILYKLALKSYKRNEVPVGAIIIYNNKIIGKGYNNRQSKSNVCGHAEVNAIIDAEKHLNDWRLNDCIIITTLKPCNMCYEIIMASRINKIYYILNQEKTSYKSNSIIKLDENNEFVEKINNIFNNFFKKIR
ncbi:MAG: nucleoside deaminase [Bacilli bacterium]|nr:nucleoside deaminase [Bacilli bacterium]